MKKKYLVIAGMAAVCILMSGCGKDKEPAVTEEVVSVTPTPVPTVTEGALVNMQKNEEDKESELSNVIGTKTASANEITLENQLGAEIAELYVRPNTEQYTMMDEWGDEQIQASFKLANKDKALYYYEPKTTDDNGEAIKAYDIRVAFSNENANEYFFRGLPLDSISSIVFCVEGSDDGAIPYVKYRTKGSNGKEVSTLESVKRRIGLEASETEDEDEELTPTPTPEETQDPLETPTPVPTQAEEPDPNVEPDPDTEIDDSGAQEAAGYIGQSLDTLVGAIGAPSSSEYANEPETGQTGYHYYDTFTVSTSVDEDGNEVVAGVW
ncbi:MAG: hypothetical protein Q4B26_04685 [Eubacteriales bacterium]|nr:hypothetical protein [Eubacteriales bacterium]